MKKSFKMYSVFIVKRQKCMENLLTIVRKDKKSSKWPKFALLYFFITIIQTYFTIAIFWYFDQQEFLDDCGLKYLTRDFQTIDFKKTSFYTECVTDFDFQSKLTTLK